MKNKLQKYNKITPFSRLQVKGVFNYYDKLYFHFIILNIIAVANAIITANIKLLRWLLPCHIYVKFINTNTGTDNSKEYLEKLYSRLAELTDVLGIIIDRKEEMLDADIEALIEERQAARKEKNFARADAIREELLEKGIILEDTREGVKWKRA